MNTSKNAARLTLSITAAVLFALIMLQTLGMPAKTAQAGLVSKTGGYTMLTVNGGRPDELLFVIDDRNENLFVYSIEGGRIIELQARESLPEMFTAARAQSIGQRP
ncbi:MAG: hypothetical protein D6695_01830 [Planctomycetota bacterium]|nr:MAG: hypothetical protein D6695_01830 [Planctomycetota bacterium]